jgi:hypothetical protein
MTELIRVKKQKKPQTCHRNQLEKKIHSIESSAAAGQGCQIFLGA